MTQNHPKRTTYTPRFLILALAALLAVVVTSFAGSGLALGPRLPGGSRALLLQSDDNFSAGQVTRVVALVVENEQLGMGR